MDKIQPKIKQKPAAPESRKIQKVVSGTAKVKKKSEVRKFADIFIAEDAAEVKRFIVDDLVVPGIKKLIVSIIKNSAEMIFGETGDRDRFSSGARLGYISYDKYSSSRRDDRRDRNTRTRTRFDYEDVIFESRADAENARMQMEEVIDKYGFVTVSDLYDMADLSAPYTGNRYGWTNIRTAEPMRLRDGGYILKLPRIEVLD